MDLQRPTTTTEVRGVIGLVQYYRDLWEKRSDLATGPKNKKIGWKDEPEKHSLH